jgi:ABC-type spermidine/putrescine transport system permease subunit II
MRARRHFLTGSISAFVVFFLWAPLINAGINSFNRDILMATWKGATLLWYRSALNNTTVKAGLEQTITICLATTALSLALAVTGALWWRRATAMGRRLFDLLTYLRIMLPEVVFAVALFLLFSKIGFPLGTLAVIIGHTVWNSAYAALIIQARVLTLDPALDDAAADLGASPWRVFRRVTIPGLLPGIAAAGLLAFTFSFDDVVTSYFLVGNQTSPLPVVLLSMIRFRITPEINAIGMMVMVFTVSMFGAAFLAVSRLGRGARRALSLPSVADQ